MNLFVVNFYNINGDVVIGFFFVLSSDIEQFFQSLVIYILICNIVFYSECFFSISLFVSKDVYVIVVKN